MAASPPPATASTMDQRHARIRELFDQVIRRGPEGRSAYLEGACGDDTTLREEVQSLLLFHTEDTDEPAEPERAVEGFAASKGPLVSHRTLRGANTTTRARRFRRERALVVGASLASLALLLLVSRGVDRSIHRAAMERTDTALEAILKGKVVAIQTWLKTSELLVAAWSRHPTVTEPVMELMAIASEAEDMHQALSKAPAQLRLFEAVQSITGGGDGLKIAVWDRRGFNIVDQPHPDATLGLPATELGGSVLSRVFQGETVTWLRNREGYMTSGWVPPDDKAKPGVSLITAILDKNGDPVAAMMIAGLGHQQEFEGLVHARFGSSGEAYAIDSSGYLLTESSFNEALSEAGLIDNQPTAYSAQVVRVTDPGGDLTEGFDPQLPAAEWPLTRAARSLLSGTSDSDMRAYRDYRGVPVVGAWHWLPRYRFGLVLEIDEDEAYRPVTILHSAFRMTLLALGALSALSAWALWAMVRRRRNAGSGQRVGAYRLVRPIGEGGLARVFLAQHDLLSRPAAIKILKPGQHTADNRARFEREVQLASQLRHRNTIRIYDYGETRAGLFYCAMEYVDGLTLQELVERHGPQPAERVASLLIQCTRSLREAHGRGLVHRDIKPQNIMVCVEGGEPDVIKLLDFGLARDSALQDSSVTRTGDLVGTPTYVAPERIENPACMDQRADLYSLGLVGFYLLVGRDARSSASVMAALRDSLKETVAAPSDALGAPLHAGLDQLILHCIERSPDERPASAGILLEILEGLTFTATWTEARANRWWLDHEPSSGA